MEKIVDVAVGVLIREDGKMLLSSRPEGKPYAGYWEFPGGKIEAGETYVLEYSDALVRDAILRELGEELGLELQDSTPWFVTEHRYEHAHVRLHFRRSHHFKGTPVCKEGQECGWFAATERTPGLLLPVDQAIVNRAALPEAAIYVYDNNSTDGTDEIARAARAQAQSQKSELERINEAVERHSAQQTKAVQGVLVEGMANCLIKFSRCCTPVPGDPIVGFITRGQGVSIHRADCPNYLNSLCKREKEGRWLNVSWADKTMGLYSTTLRILARDRNGLILDIAAVLNALNAKVRSLNARSLPEGNALVYVTTEVPDLASLRLIMARIRTLGGVREIDRGNG